MMLMRRVRRLAQKLHRVFDKDPEAHLAFRIRRETGGLEWTVSHGRLRVRLNGAAAPALDLALAGRTIGQVAEEVARLPGALIETSRARGYYETRTVQIPAAAALDARAFLLAGSLPPQWRFAREGAAYYLGQGSALRLAAPGQPRVAWFRDAVPGLLNERASRNVVVNPWFLGAVAGTLGAGGRLPDRMSVAGGSGLAVSVVGVASDEGDVTWLRVLVEGTATAAADPADDCLRLAFEDPRPVQPGERWTASVTTDWPGATRDTAQPTGFSCRLALRFVGGEEDENGTTEETFALAPGALRRSCASTAGDGAVSACAEIVLRYTPGQFIRFEQAFALPGLEPGDTPTSPMLPPPGTQAISQRAAESLYAPLTALEGWERPREITMAVDFFHPAQPHAEITAGAVAGLTDGPGDDFLIGVTGARPTLQERASLVLGAPAAAPEDHDAWARSRAAATFRSGTLIASLNGSEPIPTDADASQPFLLRAVGTPYLSPEGSPYLRTGGTSPYYVTAANNPLPPEPGLYVGHSGAPIVRLVLHPQAFLDAELEAFSAEWALPTGPGRVLVAPEGDLIDAADAIAAAAETERLLARPADLLMDGAGAAEAIGRDELHTPTSLLWAFLAAYAREVEEAEEAVRRLPLEMDTNTAEGEWLDSLGGLYGIPREPGEADRPYGARVIQEVVRPRGNNVAIEMALEQATGAPARVIDVVEYGPSVPNHGGTYLHDGTERYDASGKPIYGKFDVAAAFDLLGSTTPAQYQVVLRDLIGRMRDAGTYLRALEMQGGDIADGAQAGTDTTDPILLYTAFSETEPGAPAASGAPDVTAALPLSDPGAVPDDAEDTLTLTWAVTYAGLRRHDGTFIHGGGTQVDGTLAG